jgi:MFS family permease
MRKESRILLLGGNIWYLAEGMLGPLFAVFAEKVGGDVFDIAWAWSGYLFASGFMYIIMGRLADRIGNEKIMVAGYALNALMTFAYLLVASPLSLFFVQVGMGVASAMATPTWDALYARYEDRRHAGTAWGLADGSAYLVMAVSTLIGGLVVTRVSFEALFVIMGTIQIVATCYQARILRKA